MAVERDKALREKDAEIARLRAAQPTPDATTMIEELRNPSDDLLISVACKPHPEPRSQTHYWRSVLCAVADWLEKSAAPKVDRAAAGNRAMWERAGRVVDAYNNHWPALTEIRSKWLRTMIAGHLVENAAAERAAIVPVLEYVADMTCIDRNGEWTFKPGYDPQTVLNAIGRQDDKSGEHVQPDAGRDGEDGVSGSGWRLIAHEMPDEGDTVDLWVTPRPKSITAGACRVPDCWRSNGRWWRHADYLNKDGDPFVEVHNATHWMPLPDPPSAATPIAYSTLNLGG